MRRRAGKARQVGQRGCLVEGGGVALAPGASSGRAKRRRAGVRRLQPVDAVLDQVVGAAPPPEYCGSVVRSTSPTLVTPALGTPSSGTLTSCTAFTLTTTGSSGAATYSAGTLNVPQYSGGGAANNLIKNGIYGLELTYTSATALGASAGCAVARATPPPCTRQRRCPT